jgi:hypothetical protein
MSDFTEEQIFGQYDWSSVVIACTDMSYGGGVALTTAEPGL